MTGHHWAQTFTVTESDIEYLSGVLLEREEPLQTGELARALVERKLAQETAALQARYEHVRVYNPADAYEVDEQVMFPGFNYAVATVIEQRENVNENDETFRVMRLRFDDAQNGDLREFAYAYTLPHKLSDALENGALSLPGQSNLTAEDVFETERDIINAKVQAGLSADSDLVSLAGTWFPRSLMLDVNAGHLNLAEAVLDINEGGPLSTQDILEQVGGLGKSPQPLQIFSMNYALSRDERFDEVGPVNSILWYLRRVEPAEVLNPPSMLIYTPVPYDEDALTSEMWALVNEIDDEWSDIPDGVMPPSVAPGTAVDMTLNYPHRRAGTLPLNAKMQSIFPTARRTPRIYVSLVDGQDGEEYVGWVVRKDRYVFGLAGLFRKHKLPVGAHVSVRHADNSGKIIIDFKAYKARTEWVKIVTPKDGQLTFEDQKRAIGANYDETMLLGADDLAGVDALFQTTQMQRRPLTTIVRVVLTELSRSAPQSAVHGKTLYSAVNVLRRCPPAPIFAAMRNNPDFEYVGNNYWKLAGSTGS